MRKAVLYCAIGIISLAVMGSSAAFAGPKEYEIPVLCDFVGPYANLMKTWVPTRKAVIQWWNDVHGKKLGVKLVVKNYDTQYSPATVASIWPGIAAKKPIMYFGLGGSDVTALQQRLPMDKIPGVYATPSYGFAWLPNQWIFQPRPTYVAEWSGAVSWLARQHPEKRPIRVATMLAQAQPTNLDLGNGITNYVENILKPKGLAEMVAMEWIEISPVDVSSQLKKIIDAKADVILGIDNTIKAAALLRAQELYGVNIPTIASSFMTIQPLSAAKGSYKSWEGHYNADALVSLVEKDGPAYKFFMILNKKYGLSEKAWNGFGLLGLSQAILGVRAIEHAARMVGGENLTGQAVYDAFFAGPFTKEELMGFLPTLHYTKDAPFSTKNLKIKITTVKNGKYQLATPGWVPITPDVPKW